MLFLVGWLINAVALLLAALIVPGIRLAAARPHPTTHDWITLAVVALIFGVINVVIRPIVLLLSLPLEIVTLGLFTFVVNALMLLLTSFIAQRLDVGFRVDGFVPALLGALVIWIVSVVLHRVLAR